MIGVDEIDEAELDRLAELAGFHYGEDDEDQGEVDPGLKESARWVTGMVMHRLGHESVVVDKLDRFELLRPLGRGAHGHVWLARDPVLERQVAIKVPRRHGDPQVQLREARACAAVRSDHVVRVLEVGMHDGSVWMAMEWIEGVSMSEWLETKPSKAARLRVLADVAEGLHAMHRAGVVHRDIKPGNIMVDSLGRGVVADLGLARTNATTAIRIDKLTSDRSIVGTPRYMAPEVIAGEPADEHSDQYSFGVVIAEVLRPTRWSHAGELVAKACAHDPGDRWHSMAEISTKLRPRSSRLYPLAAAIGAMVLATATQLPKRAPLPVPPMDGAAQHLTAAFRAAERGDPQTAYGEWNDANKQLAEASPKLAGVATEALAEKVAASGERGVNLAAWMLVWGAQAYEDAGAWAPAARARSLAGEHFGRLGLRELAEAQRTCVAKNVQGQRC